ncbi:MAG: sigma-70 family RNA polymerase sigma factor [Bdellovibrionales bacterium]|nr:sigma-70 family RNA polymerase sigma factor [Bdellovibrionales bacterium]
MKQLTAEELMLRYQTHSPDESYEAFNELYKRYGERVFKFINSKVKNKADSEDLLQKIFIKFHESKHLYNGKYKFEQWIFVIARTQVLDFFRANTRGDQKLKNFESELDLASKEEIDLSVLDSLTADQLELLEMKFIDELSYIEISKIVGKSEVSLRKTISRMMGRLKKGEAV